MAKVRFDDGTVIAFEGTPSPEDIDFAYQQTKGSPQAANQPDASTPPFLPFAGTSVGDVAQSGRDYVGNMAQAVMHPLQTVQGIGNVALGGVQKLLPGQQPQEPYADALGEFIKQRYGSFDRAKETWKHDPVGVVADASMVLMGGGSAVGTLPKMAKVGRMAAKVGQAIDPLVATTRAARFAGAIPARVAERSLKGVAGYEINSLIKPKNRQFSYGKNPGLAVAQEGIVATSLEDLAAKASQRVDQLGAQIGQVLDAPAVATTRLNISKTLEPIQAAIDTARKNPRTNKAVIQRLENVRDDLLGVVVNPDGTTSVTKDLTALTPRQVFEFKRTIGDLTKWTDQLSDDTVVNGAMKKTYSAVRRSLEQAVPGIHSLNERYGNLLEASTAARNQALALQRHNPLSAMDMMAGALGYAQGGLDKAIMGVLLSQGARAAIQSPYIRTNLANFIAHATPTEVTAFFNRIPGLQSEMTRAGLLTGTAYQRMEAPPVFQ